MTWVYKSNTSWHSRSREIEINSNYLKEKKPKDLIYFANSENQYKDQPWEVGRSYRVPEAQTVETPAKIIGHRESGLHTAFVNRTHDL